jgi:hypothetical protein
MNNRLVAERFAAEALDTVLDYALTFKIKPVKVRLRMLKDARARHMYLAVANRPS